MLKLPFKVLLPAAALMLALPALAADVTLEVKKSDQLGDYIADGEGRSLYLFKADTQGKDGKQAAATCYDDCAKAWPPLLADAAKAGGKVQASLIGTTARKDGSKQVTYNGWPLYHFIKDAKPGDTNGQDIKGFGEEWYLLTPAGEKVHGHAKGHD
jgi:predicted lipoprotein with Yx(FWY)xxD motif